MAIRPNSNHSLGVCVGIVLLHCKCNTDSPVILFTICLSLTRAGNGSLAPIPQQQAQSQPQQQAQPQPQQQPQQRPRDRNNSPGANLQSSNSLQAQSGQQQQQPPQSGAPREQRGPPSFPWAARRLVLLPPNVLNKPGVAPPTSPSPVSISPVWPCSPCHGNAQRRPVPLRRPSSRDCTQRRIPILYSG